MDSNLEIKNEGLVKKLYISTQKPHGAPEEKRWYAKITSKDDRKAIGVFDTLVEVFAWVQLVVEEIEPADELQG